MSFEGKISKQTGKLDNRVEQNAAREPNPGSTEDPAVDRALRDFRLSVHAWSDAAYNRPRQLQDAAPIRTAWGRAAVWSLGCVLAAGVAGGGFLEFQHHQEMARIAAAREAQHQRQLAEQRAREAEKELAKVDNDVAREVPNAMEPLAQLMAEDESQ
jgi:hypothetical protein